MNADVPASGGGKLVARILLVLDGSARAERAIPYVTALARAFDSEVALLRVVEGSAGGNASWTDPVEWRLERSEAVAYLESVKERLVREGIPVDIDIGVGSASTEILQSAVGGRVDLVALTTHGRGEATGVAIAGTAHKVVTSTETSILLVPAGSEDGSEGPRRVLVGLDGSPRAEWALCVGAKVARAARVPMVLAHVVVPPEVLESGDPGAMRKLADELVDESLSASKLYLSEVSTRLPTPELELETRSVHASTTVPRALAELAAEEPDTLVVLSARGRSAVSGCTYGSVARAMVEAGEHPVLALCDAPARQQRAEQSPEPVTWSRRRNGIPST